MGGGDWAHVYGAWGEMMDEGNAAKVKRDTNGVQVGPTAKWAPGASVALLHKSLGNKL